MIFVHAITDAAPKGLGVAVFAATCWWTERRYRQNRHDARIRRMFAGNRRQIDYKRTGEI